LTPEAGPAKCGLWEDGKRIEWFNDKMAKAVQDGENYSHLFLREESGSKIIVGSNLEEPYNFKLEIKKVN
jgi:hypothetical protein